jgi:hypothetical protein
MESTGVVMSQIYAIGILLALMGCHEPCKDGYGRADDGLCYRLAGDPLAPCGDGMGRDDEGTCLPFGDEVDTAATDDVDGDEGDGDLDADEGSDEGSDDGEVDGGASADTDADGSAPEGGATVKGTLSTTNGLGFEAGDQVVLQAWTEATIDPETGWPIDDAMELASHVSSAAVVAMSIHYSFEMPAVPVGGTLVRLTAHFTDVPTEWEGSPRGGYPIAIDEWLSVSPGSTNDGVNITIDNGEAEPDSGPPASDGGPVSDEGPPVSDEGPPVSDEGPPVSDEGPPVSDEGPPVSDEGPPVSDEGPPVDSDDGPADDDG